MTEKIELHEEAVNFVYDREKTDFAKEIEEILGEKFTGEKSQMEKLAKDGKEHAPFIARFADVPQLVNFMGDEDILKHPHFKETIVQSRSNKYLVDMLYEKVKNLNEQEEIDSVLFLFAKYSTRPNHIDYILERKDKDIIRILKEKNMDNTELVKRIENLEY